jgi:hypothetical protein
MKCLECGKPEVQSKGMCPACYTRWRRAGRPPTRFDYKPPVEKFRIDCQNGKVLGLLAMKMTHLDIARKYGMSEATVRKYMVHYGLIDPKARSIKKKDREGIFYEPSKMLALAMPWVKNETPRYHFSF